MNFMSVVNLLLTAPGNRTLSFPKCQPAFFHSLSPLFSVFAAGTYRSDPGRCEIDVLHRTAALEAVEGTMALRLRIGSDALASRPDMVYLALGWERREQ